MLKIGNWYKVSDAFIDKRKPEEIKEKKLIGIYDNFLLFELEGIRECYPNNKNLTVIEKI